MKRRYDDFADGLDAIVWELDVRSRRFTFITRYAEAALGYPRERWLEEADFWSTVLHARDGISIDDVVAAASRKGMEHQLEYPVVAKDGWTVWLRDSIRVVPEAEGGRLRGVTVNITESKWGEEALRQSEARYRGLYEGVPLGLYRTSPEGELLAANDFFVRTLGYPTLEALVEEGDALPAGVAGRSGWSTALLGGAEVRRFEVQHRRPDASRIWIRNTVRAVSGQGGEVAYYEGVLEDVTERKRAEEAERAAEAQFRSLVEQALVGIYIVAQGRLVYANPRFCEIFGSEAETLMGLGSLEDLVIPEDRAEVARYFRSCHAGGAEQESLTFRCHGPNDGEIEVEARGSPTQYRGNRAVIGTLLDVTERKQAEDRLLHAALHDALTGLPNRVLFTERLDHAMLRGKRSAGPSFAVLFLDLDRFKVVNDSLGHAVGDRLLVAVADRLKLCLRPGDTVARLGGDEFAILLENISDVGEATHVADRIRREVAAPIDLDGYETFTSASIGIVLGSAEHDGPAAVLRNADMAMYRAKAAGVARFAVYDRAMHAEALKRLQMETDLRHALDRDEFRLRYQPIVDLGTGRLAGFEALVRWEHPDRGPILPIDFIPLAEENGIIVPIGQWVLETACRQLASWRDELGPDSVLQMSVNLSVKEFVQPDLVRQVRKLLRATRLQPEALKLEITESMLLDNAADAAKLLTKLKSMGVGIHLDDFGTGYSSLSYLHRFPLDALKIDRSFLSGDDDRKRDSLLIRSIANLAKGLGVEVVCEGVETVAQLAEVRALGCEFGQGYLFAKPLEPGAAAKLLHGEPPWGRAWEESSGVRDLHLMRQA